MYKRT